MLNILWNLVDEKFIPKTKILKLQKTTNIQ